MSTRNTKSLPAIPEGDTRISGASDDLIELEGAIEQEFDADGDKPNYVAFDCGVVLSVDYGGDGIWTIRCLAGDDKCSRVRETKGGCDPLGYSDVWDVRGAKIAVGGHEIGKARPATSGVGGKLEKERR
jgi:hypothetical protein